MTLHTTTTGRRVELRQMIGRCHHIEIVGTASATRICRHPAVEVRCDQGVPGRDLVLACLCEQHGGETAAIAEVMRDWSVQAPPEVGDDEAVETAGIAVLRSEHAIVVVRPENGRWIAALGVGSHTMPVRRRDIDLERARKASPEHRRAHPTSRRRGGGNSFATAEDAMTAAVEAWRVELDRRLAEILAMRGGTLAWGMAVEPHAEPIRLVCRPGQSGYDARVGAE